MNGSRREHGQGLVEYALILVLVALVVIGILLVLGPSIRDVYNRVVQALGGTGLSRYITSTSPSVTDLGGSIYRLTVTVYVNAQTNVTLSAGSKSQTISCSPPSCQVSVTNIPQSGTYTVTDGEGAQVSGSY